MEGVIPMYKSRIARLPAGLVLSGILVTAGCVGTQSMSNVARTGDTVMVAFGPESDPVPYRREDLRAEIKDFNNVVYPVTIRAVVNVYADPTSRVGADKGNFFDSVGLRSAVVDLVTPGTGAKPSLAVGAAKLSLRRLSDNAPVASDMQLTILSGTGAINPLQDQFTGLSFITALEARPQVRFRIAPLVATYDQLVGAAEIELRLPLSALAGMPETSWPTAVQTSSDQHLRFSAAYVQEGTDHVIRAAMVNPVGMRRAQSISLLDGYRGTSPYETLRLAVAWGTPEISTSYAPETFDRALVVNATRSFRVFGTDGADLTAHFALVTE